MNQPNQCQKCGSRVTSSSPAGLCPACLLEQGMGPDPDFLGSPEPALTTPPGGRFVPPSPKDLAPYFPQLEIDQLLGQGGMGAVYRARQKSLDRQVALKIINPQAAEDPTFAERFGREARALARLSHPHIVTVHDFGQEAGLYFLIMEYVDGLSLRQLMASGELDSPQALAIVPQICEALQFAHDEGIMHRDIKPENILLDKRGRVKIADFGLAKMLGQKDDYTLTSMRQIIGTPHYMAPEQIERPMEVDHRADIYSLGVVFYEMLTGQLPLGRFSPPSAKAKVDTRLDQIVLRSLEKEPRQRFQQADQFRTELESLADGKYLPSVYDSNVTFSGSSEIRDKVHGPAIGLMAAGIIDVACLIIWFLLGFIGIMGMGRIGFMHSNEEEVMIICAGAVALGIIKIFAALKMKDLEWRAMSIFALILALLPISPSCIVGIPVGLWGLALLTKREVKAAFDAQAGLISEYGSSMGWQEEPQAESAVTSNHSENVEPHIKEKDPTFETSTYVAPANIAVDQLAGIRQKVSAPGIALMIAGAVALLPFFPLCILPTLLGGPGINEVIFIGLLVMFLCLPMGIVMLIGGAKMKSLNSYNLAMVASVLAVLPITPTCLITFPIGIWALIVLNDEKVKAGFRGEVFAGEVAPVIDQEPRLCKTAVVGAVLAALGLVLVVLITLPVAVRGGASGSLPPTPVFATLILLPLLLLGPVLSTILGFVSVVRIKNSRGMLRGMPLALGVSLFYPLLILDAIVLAILARFADQIALPDLWLTRGPYLAIVVVAVIDLLIVRLVWRAVVGQEEWEEDYSTESKWGDEYTSSIRRVTGGSGGIFLLGIVVLVCVLVVLAFGLPMMYVSRSATHQRDATPQSATARVSDGHSSHAHESSTADAIEMINQKWHMSSDGPHLNDGFALSTWRLDPRQIIQINKALSEIHLEYQKLLKQNMEVSLSKDRQVSKFTSFTTEMDALENKFWTMVDPVLTENQQKTLRYNLNLRPTTGYPIQTYVHPKSKPRDYYAIFPWCDIGGEIEIWKVGQWFHWKVKLQKRDRGGSYATSGQAPRLPELFKDFWNDPTVSVQPAISGPPHSSVDSAVDTSHEH